MYTIPGVPGVGPRQNMALEQVALAVAKYSVPAQNVTGVTRPLFDGPLAPTAGAFGAGAAGAPTCRRVPGFA